MIEVELAKTGVPVLKRDGLWLGSSVDPEREARIWVQKVLPLLAGFKNIVVLGLGSGYQIAALLESLATPSYRGRIVVIEEDLNLVEHVLGIHHELRSLRVMRASDVRAQEELVGQIYRVLRHPTGFSQGDSLLRRAEERLIGRTPAGLLWQMQVRAAKLPSFAVEFDSTRIAAHPEKIFSIRDCEDVFSLRRHENQAPSLRSTDASILIWNLLQELIL